MLFVLLRRPAKGLERAGGTAAIYHVIKSQVLLYLCPGIGYNRKKKEEKRALRTYISPLQRLYTSFFFFAAALLCVYISPRQVIYIVYIFLQQQQSPGEANTLDVIVLYSSLTHTQRTCVHGCGLTMLWRHCCAYSSAAIFI